MKKEFPNQIETLKQIKTIMNDPSFEVPENDKSFLFSDDARGIRLQLDYLKAEMKMREQGIRHTIVVFGSARIIEFDFALKRVNKIKQLLIKSPSSTELLNKLKDSKNMLKKSFYYEEARKFGRLVGKSGKGSKDCYVTLMTGGGPGIMEAANRGAWDVGAKSIGLNITLPNEQKPNPYITPELCFTFHYFAIRKLHFMHKAKALVIFPGGFGTLDELFDILTLIQTKKSPAIPIILVGKEYWEKVINFKFLEEEEMIKTEELQLLSYVENAKEAWDSVMDWYKKNKSKLF